MQDVVKNATTELISGRKIELVMNLKGLLHSCNVDNIDIVLISYYEPNYRQIDIEIEKTFIILLHHMAIAMCLIGL